MRILLAILLGVAFSTAGLAVASEPQAEGALRWEALPDLPEPLGVAGPFVGVHHDALIVAGGANFPVAEGEDRWQAPKVWHDNAWVLVRDQRGAYAWHGGFQLPRPIGYGVVASTRFGVVCLGGEDGQQVFDEAMLLTWDREKRELVTHPLPRLPRPMAFGAAVAIGDVVYVAGGQEGLSLKSARGDFWRMDLSPLDRDARPEWEPLPPLPGPARAFHIAAAQHNGFDPCVYVIGGRRAADDTAAAMNVVPLADVYEFCPARYDDPAAFDPATGAYRGAGLRAEPWRRRADLPQPVMAGTAIAVGQSHLFVLSGDAGALWTRTEQLQDDHPGFEPSSWIYHTITDTWTAGPRTPANQVTTPAVRWGDGFVLASGETRPRHRTPAVWFIRAEPSTATFGPVNFSVLVVYLLGMVGVGVFFAARNRSTDDFFRGGQRVPWWVAGMSIYATMLSSITYMAIPAKAFAQDWVYLTGNFMILAVAPVAVYVALPFFRRIDATSAYEYLDKRFNFGMRLFGSGSFTVFHICRMGIVMSLAGLALAAVTPLSPAQCVLLIGLLSVVYCTLGGVEAVVWTDTIQTVVLLGGAILCLVIMVAGAEENLGGLLTTAWESDKFRAANLHWDLTSANLALWVVLIGGFGQQFASYTSDQAVVQRYMTTPDQKRAARAIWTNALLAVPGSFLFFGVGAGLYVFYKAHPEKLDPTFSTDQILPLFISHELPIGIAGLVVAGIFAAAQSTVSTSMNSTATTVVTDFLRPFGVLRSERSYLWAARALTLLLGCGGTLLGLWFVDPAIRSLWDQFIAVIGLFMGVLGGLFCLGMLTMRANGLGAAVGAVCGATAMLLVARLTAVQGFLYAAIGIGTCFVTGYAASLLTRAPGSEVDGLTVYTLARR
ncbi:MAG: sodium:solute symporter [Thermoguttaceae bacterium]|jgi:SSS family transporter|nr:sodium:solute symporter [Thermoguttaceae bacterium]